MPPFFAALFGLVLGSFYSVCISRYGTGTTIFYPARSHCPSCNHLLTIKENIPIASFLLQRGRCAHCLAKISYLYPTIELTSMVWAVLAAIHSYSIPEWVTLIIIGGICIVASGIDLHTFLLPDVLTYSGVVIVLGASYFSLLPIHFADSLIGAFVGAGLLWTLAILFKILRKIDGLGYGDVKFMLMLGGLVGWQGLSWLILCASTTALLYAICHLRNKEDITKTPIPFGPFLALGACITFLYQTEFQSFFYQ